MDRLNALGRGAQIMLVAAVLLLISTFFNWQEVDFDLGALGEGSAGVSAWDNFWGVVMGLLTIVLIAWLGARLAGIDIPVPMSTAMISAVLAALILLFAVLKNLIDDYSTFWSYLGVALAVVIAIGAWLEVQAAGGMDKLRAEMPAMGSSPAPSAPAASAPPPAPETMPERPAPPAADEPAPDDPDRPV